MPARACSGPSLVHNWTMDVPEPFFEQRLATVMSLFIINLHGNAALAQAALTSKLFIFEDFSPGRECQEEGTASQHLELQGSSSIKRNALLHS